MSESRYRGGEPDYAHHFHAGNVGDVFKHCVLGAWLRALQTGDPLRVVDTHAGAGMYPLPPSGEWDAGIGRLDALDAGEAPPAVQAYLAAAGDRRTPNKGGLYPGSPAIIRGQLRAEDRLTLVEMADAPREKLASFYAEDAQVEVRGGDGLAVAVEAADRAGRLAVFVDPSYARKAEWDAVAEAARAVHEANPEASVLVWYPIKSLARPQRLAGAVRDLGAGATLDLVSTPLGKQRKALNGSGVLALRPPAGFVEQMSVALPWLGAALANPAHGEWTASVRGWTTAPPHTEVTT